MNLILPATIFLSDLLMDKISSAFNCSTEIGRPNCVKVFKISSYSVSVILPASLEI